MPEENGTGRLDRIEKILDMFIADHERIRQAAATQRFSGGVRARSQAVADCAVLMQDNLEKLSNKVDENTRQLELMREKDRDQDKRISALDERVDKLVIAIGEFIRSRPNTIQ